MRTALYARVSTVRQAENDLSIPDQVQADARLVPAKRPPRCA